jgi:hypothetical protein
MKITSLAVAAFCLAARAEAFTGPQLARQSRFGVVSTVRACVGCCCCQQVEDIGALRV